LRALLLLALAAAEPTPEQEALEQLSRVRRIHVEKLNGGDTAGQMRDMIISSLQNSRRFVITENPDRADAVLRGSAEDLVFTDTFQSSDSLNARASVGAEPSSSGNSRRQRGMSIGVGENESTRIAERKHEASASVRLVANGGDIIWSATEESQGAKFRGASADVADKIVKRLAADFERARRAAPVKGP
jgi:hypothetical protein